MIAQAQNTLLPAFLRSSRLGAVTLPAPTRLDSSVADQEPEIDRQAARNLLRGLGENLGLTSLSLSEEEALPGNESSFGDEAVAACLRQCDAVWMNGQEPVAAFAVETGDGLNQGPRNFGDLLALFPKWKGALYLVSMSENQAELIAEMHRPLYRLLKKSLPEIVRLLPWPRLQAEVLELGDKVRYLKPEFLEGISELTPLQPE